MKWGVLYRKIMSQCAPYHTENGKSTSPWKEAVRAGLTGIYLTCGVAMVQLFLISYFASTLTGGKRRVAVTGCYLVGAVALRAGYLVLEYFTHIS